MVRQGTQQAWQAWRRFMLLPLGSGIPQLRYSQGGHRARAQCPEWRLGRSPVSERVHLFTLAIGAYASAVKPLSAAPVRSSVSYKPGVRACNFTGAILCRRGLNDN